MSAIILEFVERDDFVAELQAQAIKSVRLEIEYKVGEPRGDLGNASHTVSAVATAFCIAPFNLTPQIIRWQTVILITDSISMRFESDKSREKMFTNFEIVRAEFEKLGFNILRGQWKLN